MKWVLVAVVAVAVYLGYQNMQLKQAVDALKPAA